MLDRDEIADVIQDYLGCHRLKAMELAKEIDKATRTKAMRIDWLPNIILVVVCIAYLIKHW